MCSRVRTMYIWLWWQTSTRIDVGPACTQLLVTVHICRVYFVQIYFLFRHRSTPCLLIMRAVG